MSKRLTEEEFAHMVEIATDFYIATGHVMSVEHDPEQVPDKVWRARGIKRTGIVCFFSGTLEELDNKVQQFIYEFRGIPSGEIRNSIKQAVNSLTKE